MRRNKETVIFQINFFFCRHEALYPIYSLYFSANSPDCNAERAKKTNKQTRTEKMYQAENLCQRIILLQDFLKSPYDHRNAKRHLR